MKTLLVILLINVTSVLHGQDVSENWNIFFQVKFTEKFFKELNEYFLIPLIDTNISAYEGKEFKLTGHFLPFDLPEENAVVISKYPYAQCFFCLCHEVLNR